MPLTLEQAAYLAGVIDGEGCITFTGKPIGTLRLQIANTNHAWLTELQGWIGGTMQEHRGRFNKRPSFSLMLPLRATTETLTQVRPFLRLKMAQANVFFRWLDLRAQYLPSIRKGLPSNPAYVSACAALRVELQRLNRRGVVGQPYPGSPKSTRECSIEACGRPHHSNGYCKQHHKKYVERGGAKWREADCLRCGKLFVAKRSDAMHCSKRCADLAYYAQHKTEIIAQVSERRKAAKKHRA